MGVPALLSSDCRVEITWSWAEVDSARIALLVLRLEFLEARSSGVEHYLDTVGVCGSNPHAPTIACRRLSCRE